MNRREQKKIKQIAEGDFIFLRGQHISAKWQVTQILDGKCHMKMVGETKEYVHPETWYEVGKPLFKKGLRAFPYSSILDRDWQAFQSRKEMLRLFGDIARLSGRLPKLTNASKVLYCKKIIETFIAEMKEALKKSNDAWRESKNQEQ